MRIGVDYYPEHWDSALWEADAILMKETGVSIIRMAEFSWSRLEPEEGKYDFKWLEEAIEIFFRYGISIVLGTPTAAPTNWLVEKYPDVLPSDGNKHLIGPGVRCHRCYNSPSLRKYSDLITEEMTKHFSKNKAVIGWQTENEFGLIECHCENCNLKFREWLREKYVTLEGINKAWGNVVWSGEYSSWSQISTPMGELHMKNPSYLLDYNRFCTASTVEFQKTQIKIIRKNCPNHFITHNIWGYPVDLDYYKLFEELDFASHDNYPHVGQSNQHEALSHDLVRGVMNKNFWVMEELSGPPGGWDPMARSPYPGLIRAYSWQAISRGADTVVHFRWRSATIGAEQFWHGLIDHSNVPGRRFREFAQLCNEIKNIGGLLDGTSLKNEVAILHSHEQYTAMKIQKQAEGLDYFQNLKIIHKAFLKLGVGTDVINWRSDLEKYKVVVAPHLFLLDEAIANKIADFAKNGGTVIITDRTGVKNLSNICWMKPLPGPLSECAGVEVLEYDPIGSCKHVVRLKDSKEYKCFQWCDILRVTTASEIGWYGNDFFEGQAAITVNYYGQGKVYYIGTQLQLDFYKNFFADICKNDGIELFENLPEGVELSVRREGKTSFLFALNLSTETKTVEFEFQWKSILKNESSAGKIVLEPYGIDILQLTL